MTRLEAAARLPTHPTFWTGLAVFVLAAAVYANASGNGFALDDQFIILANERVHGVDRIPEAITQPYWPGAPGRIGLYRPLTAASFAIDWQLWGADARPFHLTNIALHALAALLVFAVLGPLVGLPGAAAGAALFAVHPVHVEAVANTVGRSELLAAILVLAAAALYQRLQSTSWLRLWAGAGAIAAAYFLGLAAKEIAVTLPALLLLLELGRTARAEPGSDSEGPGSGPRSLRSVLADALAGARRRWPVYGLLTLALAGYLSLRTWALGTPLGNDAAPFLETLSAPQRVMTAVSVWPEYLRLMLAPVDLVADYSPGVIMPALGFGPHVLAGLLVAALAALLVAACWRTQPTVSLGVLWFAVAMLPIANLAFPVGVLLAERTLYLPSVGLAMAAAGAFRWAWGDPRRRRTAIVAGIVVLTLAATRTWLRTPTWRTTTTVIDSLVRDHPESFRAQWVLADRALERGHGDEALQRFRRATALMPTHYRLRVDYGHALVRLRRYAAAARNFRAARDAVPEILDAHVNLMIALMAAGHPDQAVAAGMEALLWHPDHRAIHHQLAIALTRTGQYQRALAARQESIRLAGLRAAPLQFVHEAELFLRLGKPDDARAALQAARERSPSSDDLPTIETLRRAIETANTAVLPYR